MNYWLDLFTGTTWNEFRKAGASVSGFRNDAPVCSPGQDGGRPPLLPTGVMQWVGALEVLGPTTDTSPIWSSDAFPVRFAVKPIVLLDPEFGVPMKRASKESLIFTAVESTEEDSGFLRMSPNLFKRSGDGELVLQALRDAERNPISVPIDPKKLARKPR
ncbi:MAG: hypothetical protein U0163_16255 [Gemmatimonadaceae bacterium]